jgi:hypothetical protein
MRKQWTTTQAWEWHRAQGWLCGFNYLPRNAINWVEMWQKESFDICIIKQELEWAVAIGFNTLRTNLPYNVWKNDPDGLIGRIEEFLCVCDALDMKVMMTLLDDCGFSGEEPFLGKQKPPTFGVHNSQAAASPGRKTVMKMSDWPMVERYVRNIVRHFAKDQRIAIWDLYNEPTNRMIFSKDGEQSFSFELEAFSHRLMKKTFYWARDEDPIQPLTVGAWHTPNKFDRTLPMFEHPTDVLAMQLSDVISFHAYLPLDLFNCALQKLETYNRPLFCTEWLGRHAGSSFHEQLPIFNSHLIGCYQWGLVKGKTQTHIPWPMIKQSDTNHQEQWFHDFLHEDGQPYNVSEAALIHELKKNRNT